MSTLKSEPAGQLRSMGEFFALARAMEADAVRHYTETANALRKQNSLPLAYIFELLAKFERDHVDRVAEWAAEHKGAAVATVAPWPIPDAFDVSPEEIAQSSLMTPYRALAIAVRYEERSFTFWTYVAAQADGEVKEAAERMAREQLDHVSVLRQERRLAFHSNRRAAKAESVTLGALAATERRLALLIEQHDGRTTDDAVLRRYAATSREAAEKLDALETITHQRLSIIALPAERREDPVALCEYLAEAYLHLAEISRNERVLIAAQDLATDAIDRLAAMRSKMSA
ncbi:conserved hypothetical protein [Hyphomicrobium sp. GJ21]|uniref:ferritin-like domain-containing protein n=1 Tax=Hyphomicrobium sp. GJ21 TaxID=113574 RepID=UPI000622BCDB|nr:ferritin family protein [Hyphomicrobium sp. GJ21]MBN9352532.1 ferritin family protein [Hyphomicrobium denitrificans]CEJ84676.1 conserved hypothetical protein [Hyphomicrobium sp. GJ21]